MFLKNLLNSIMGRYAFPKNESNTSEEKEINEPTIQNKDQLIIGKYKFNLNKDIFPLLYFSDGRFKNIDKSLKEPSAISTQLPLSTKFYSSEKIGYYPSYINLSPSQKFRYLNWLSSNLKSPEIGFAFLLLYSIDRNIDNQTNLELSVKVISKLQNIVQNKSFIYYSSASLARILISYGRNDLFSEINPQSCDLSLRLNLDNKVYSTDVFNLCGKQNFKDDYYKRKYPSIFKNAINQTINDYYGQSYLEYHRPSNTSNIPQIKLMLSNYSLDDREVIINDFTKDISFINQINETITRANKLCRDIIKSSKTISKSNDKKKTIKRINSKTGYPMSTDKQIERAKQELENSQRNFTPSNDWTDKQLDYILPRYHKGILLYRQGEWDKAEKEWLEIIYLMPHAVNKLGIMYRKENRYKDVVLINKTVAYSETMKKIYNTYITQDDIDNAEINYKKNINKDKSKLTVNDLKNLKK